MSVVVDKAGAVSQGDMEAYVSANYIPKSEKAAPGGVATLDDANKLDKEQIPNIDCGIWDVF